MEQRNLFMGRVSRFCHWKMQLTFHIKGRGRLKLALWPAKQKEPFTPTAATPLLVNHWCL